MSRPPVENFANSFSNTSIICKYLMSELFLGVGAVARKGSNSDRSFILTFCTTQAIDYLQSYDRLFLGYNKTPWTD